MKKLLIIILAMICQFGYGQNWQSINSPTSKNIRSCSFIDKDLGWIITQDSIFKTTDGGNTWTNQTYPPTPAFNSRHFNSIHFINQNVGVIGCGNYLYTGVDQSQVSSILWTNDGGNTWEYKHLGGQNSYIIDAKLASPTVAYAVAQYGKLKKTTDGGNTWTNANYTSYYTGSQLFPINQDIVYFAGLNNILFGGAFGSTVNGGANWMVTPVSNDTSMQAIYFTDGMIGWLGGYNGEILATSNGGASWTPCSTSTTGNISGIAFRNNIIGWATTNAGEILKTIDGGSNWITEYNQNSGLSAISFPGMDTIGYAVGDSGMILKYTYLTSAQSPVVTSELQVFPNPANSKITIMSDYFNKPNSTITIHNILGKKVITQKSLGNPSQLDISSLENGVYLIRIDNGKHEIIKRFIKSGK